MRITCETKDTLPLSAVRRNCPAFKGLRKKRLVESIRTGRKWKNYIFGLLEVAE